jgi:hypothetical protein
MHYDDSGEKPVITLNKKLSYLYQGHNMTHGRYGD